MYLAKCPYKHHDCFQYDGLSKCKLLTKQPTGPECPFYKTEDQVRAGRLKAHDRLEDQGRYDLIEKFEHNPSRNW